MFLHDSVILKLYYDRALCLVILFGVPRRRRPVLSRRGGGGSRRKRARHFGVARCRRRWAFSGLKKISAFMLCLL